MDSLCLPISYLFTTWTDYQVCFVVLLGPVCLQLSQNNLASMNPADSDPLEQELRAQAEAIQHHEQRLTSVMVGLQEISICFENIMESVRDHLQRLTISEPAPASLAAQSSKASEPQLPPPERYFESPGVCRSFLVQCSLTFQLSQQSRGVSIISLVSGRVKKWGTAVATVQSLSAELCKVCDHTTPSRETASALY